jgi:hypothetical protein
MLRQTRAVTGRLMKVVPLWLTAAALLCACGSGDHPLGGGAAKAAASAKKPVNPADARLRNMVSAVAATKGSSVPVQVKFELQDRPTVAQPVAVDLVIVPLSAAVDSVSGKIETDDGLDVLEGRDIPAADHPQEGTPIEHSLKLRASRDGIFTCRAVITVLSGSDSSTETFLLPVIAGSGLPDQPTKPAPKSPKTAAAH